MSGHQSNEMSRAEKVRARRQQSQKSVPNVPVGSSAVRKPKNTSIPVTRRPMTPIPHVTRKRNKAYIPLTKKGVEVQLPVFPQIKFGWRAISGAIFLLSLVIVISFSSLSTFKVSGLNLKGAKRLTSEVILPQIDIVNSSIIGIVPNELEDVIQDSFPSIVSAHISVGLPAVINLEINERDPIILWQQDEKEYWIDAEGIMFPVFGEAENLLLVNANGIPPAPPKAIVTEEDDVANVIDLLSEPSLSNTTPEFVQAILSLSAYVPTETTLQYDPSFGLGWRDPQGWLVYFGKDSNNIDTKLTQYQTIIRVLEQRNIYPALISLEFLHAPYYRLEQ